MNWIKVVPEHRLASRLSFDSPKGLPVIRVVTLRTESAGQAAPLAITRTTRKWMNSFVESTESIFKELEWELTLERK